MFISDLVRQLKPVSASFSDAALLADYCARRDGGAFAELLRRHGPIVLGVCRRILPNAQDVEDAFQAVFMVLACKAKGIRPASSVGSWLYGVALRTARKAKTATARRTRREMTTAQTRPDSILDDGPNAIEHDETRRIIADEIGKLPTRLRGPILACDVAGKSRADAARHLGWPEGTVATRLAKGGKVLAERLTRRGVTLPAAGLTAALIPNGISAALVQSTVAATEAFATGSASLTVCHSAQTLAQGVLMSMNIKQLTWFAAGLLAVAFLVGGTALVLWSDAPANAAEPPLAQGQPIPPAPKNQVEATWKELPALKLSGWAAGSVAFSPGGKMLVVGGSDGHVRAYDVKQRTDIWDYGKAGHFAAVAFSPDGLMLAATCKDGIQFFEPDTGKPTEKLTEEGIAPTIVAFFPESPIEGTTKMMRKVIFGDVESGPEFIRHKYVVRMGVEWAKASTISTAGGNGRTWQHPRPKRHPARGVAGRQACRRHRAE